MIAKHINPVRYKIAQNIRSRRLKRRYTLKALADKTGIKYYTLLKYEQGACGIPTGELRKIANALQDKVGNLFPRRKVLRENNCFDKDRIQKMYDIMGKYIQAGERETRKAIYAVTQSIRAQKARFSVDIIYQVTGLSTNEYDNKEKPKRQIEGREMKKWRIILRRYSRRFSRKGRCITYKDTQLRTRERYHFR